MKHDFYLKSILTVIAVCLVLITAKAVPLPFISIAKAATAEDKPKHCTGKIMANTNGADTPIVGGYDVDVTCV